MSFKPTQQQQDAADAFATKSKLRIGAYAGTGKTSSLAFIAGTTKRRGLYLAFNKSIAEDAKRRFPSSVNCSTTHAMAFRAMRSSYSVDKMTNGINAGLVQRALELRSLGIAPGKVMSPRGHGSLVADTVKRFMRSGSSAMGAWCVPLEGSLATLDEDSTRALQARVMGAAWKLWGMMVDPSSAVPLTHDGYLKVWAMGNPVLPGEYVLLDEAQDTNGVVLELIRAQPAQVVCVGDAHQSIYEWRGAQNAMLELPCDVEVRLSKSWRFGPAIAANASQYLALLNEKIPLTGNEARASRIGAIDRPDAILARTNARLIEVLMAALERGERPHVVGGVSEILAFLDGAESLMAGRPVERPLELFGFQSWTEVEDAADQEGGQDLRRMTNMISKYGVNALRAALERLPKHESDGTILLSTGHKSKGREWGSVRLEDDFLRGVRTDKDNKEKKAVEALEETDHAAELRLLYVAATRGMDAVEIPDGINEKLAAIASKRREAA